tara:strand:+ start:1 stop:1245 length:1245 start_codon:yes stop_codon:yes gene_type:complete
MPETKSTKERIPEGWVETTLGEICDVKGGKRLPKGSSLVIEKTNHPYIRITDLNKHQVIKSGLEYVPDEIFSKISRYIVNSGDIIISIVGTIGLVAEIDDDLNEASLTENCVKLINLNQTESKYLFYYLVSRRGQYEINRNTVGAVQKKLPIYGVQNIEILLPPLPEQRAIADVLSSFDDKIELLREQNKILEQTAQTIFKEWFGKYSVDRPEELPHGWRIENIGEKNFSEVIGSGIKKFDGEKIYLATADVSNNNITNIDTKITYENRASRANMQPVEKSIFFAKMQDSRKLLMFDDFSKSDIENMILSTGFAGIKTTEISHYYLWNFVLSSQFDDLINNLANGAVQVALNNISLKKIQVVVPNDEVLKNFNKIVKPLFKKIFTNKSQIQSLEKTRDTLLPKLMRGEVRVSLN